MINLYLTAHFTVSENDNKIPVAATWGHRPHNFLAMGRRPHAVGAYAMCTL